VNRHLKILSLDYNSLGDRGASALAAALEENTRLEGLDLEGNQISDVGAEALLEAMKHNGRLEDITLMPGNDIRETTLTAIKEQLAAR